MSTDQIGPLNVEELRKDLSAFICSMQKVAEEPAVWRHYTKAETYLELLRKKWLCDGWRSRVDREPRSYLEGVFRWVEECWMDEFEPGMQDYHREQDRSRAERVAELLELGKDCGVRSFLMYVNRFMENLSPATLDAVTAIYRSIQHAYDPERDEEREWAHVVSVFEWTKETLVAFKGSDVIKCFSTVLDVKSPKFHVFGKQLTCWHEVLQHMVSELLDRFNVSDSRSLRAVHESQDWSRLMASEIGKKDFERELKIELALQANPTDPLPTSPNVDPALIQDLTNAAIEAIGTFQQMLHQLSIIDYNVTKLLGRHYDPVLKSDYNHPEVRRIQDGRGNEIVTDAVAVLRQFADKAEAVTQPVWELLWRAHRESDPANLTWKSESLIPRFSGESMHAFVRDIAAQVIHAIDDTWPDNRVVEFLAEVTRTDLQQWLTDAACETRLKSESVAAIELLGGGNDPEPLNPVEKKIVVHPRGTIPPAEYHAGRISENERLGPLIGTKAEIGFAMTETGKTRKRRACRDYCTQLMDSGMLWVRYSDMGDRKLDAFIRAGESRNANDDLKRLHDAQAKLKSAPDMK